MGFTCSLIFMHTSYHDNNPLLANLVNIYIYKTTTRKNACCYMTCRKSVPGLKRNDTY